MSKVNVLVLGGAGFLGQKLIERLTADGYCVTAIDRYWKSKPTNVRCLEGDVFDENYMSAILPSQEIVFHLVSTTVPATSNRSPVFDCETNVLGTLRILNTMLNCHVKQIIFVSSGGTVYGIPKKVPITEDAATFPLSAYGVGKLAIERYLYLYAYMHGFRSTVVRLSNPYGEGQDPEKGQGVIAAFAKKAIEGSIIEVWGDGSVIRDFIYIDDALDALVAAINLTESFTLMNIGSGKGHSLTEILRFIEKLSDKSLTVHYQPSRLVDAPEIVLDITLAQRILKWKPSIPIETGIKRVLASYQSALKAPKTLN